MTSLSLSQHCQTQLHIIFLKNLFMVVNKNIGKSINVKHEPLPVLDSILILVNKFNHSFKIFIILLSSLPSSLKS